MYQYLNILDFDGHIEIKNGADCYPSVSVFCVKQSNKKYHKSTGIYDSKYVKKSV
jgi:hypothetical protein